MFLRSIRIFTHYNQYCCFCCFCCCCCCCCCSLCVCFSNFLIPSCNMVLFIAHICNDFFNFQTKRYIYNQSGGYPVIYLVFLQTYKEYVSSFLRTYAAYLVRRSLSNNKINNLVIANIQLPSRCFRDQCA